MGIRQKVMELSVALIKVSVGARRMEFRRRLEIAAFELVHNAAMSNFETVLKHLEEVEEMTKFGKTIYEIEPITAQTIIAECGNCRDMVRQFAGLDFREDISSMFTSFEPIKSDTVPAVRKERKVKRANSAKKDILENAAMQNAANDNSAMNNAAMNNAAIKNVAIALPNPAIQLRNAEKNAAIDDDAAMRQSAIVDKMRQFGNKQVQLKDLIAEFDGVSDRTIRYDLQKLCNQGILERLGTGGPGTYYKIRVL